MKSKKMIVWSMKTTSVQVQAKERTSHYYNLTPSTWERIEQLTWNADNNNLRVYGYTDKAGLMGLVIERR